MAKFREKMEVVPVSILREVVREKLEEALGVDGRRARVTTANAKLIYEAVMDAVFEVIDSLEVGQEITLADWIAVRRTINDARVNAIKGRTTYTGSVLENDYWKATSRIKFRTKGKAENNMRKQHENDEARAYLKKKYGEEYVPYFDKQGK